MIASLLVSALTLAIQGSDAFGSLAVRNGDRVATVPIVLVAGTPMIRADQFLAAVGGELKRQPGDAFIVKVREAELEVSLGLPVVRTGDAILPLQTGPTNRGGQLYLPYQLVSEILPRYAKGVQFDAARGQLRLPAEVAAAPREEPAATPPRASTPAPPSGRPTPAPPRGSKRRVVVIDAGHGGPDRGMSGPIGSRNKVYEKTITLQVARELKRALNERGIDVVMTRDTDTLIALSDRGRIANQRRGDVFLSIHVNAANPRWTQPAAARGFETYFLSEAKTEDERRVEQMENEAVKYEVDAEAEKGDPINFILHDMEQNEHLRESSQFAQIVQRSLGITHPGPNRGVKQAGFRVLVTALMPAVLVEIGFGSNASEAAYMSDPKRQREIAQAIADGTVSYLAQYERRSSATGQ
jgi:N-acetylmuramoyl-L-alanine amidase